MKLSMIARWRLHVRGQDGADPARGSFAPIEGTLRRLDRDGGVFEFRPQASQPSVTDMAAVRSRGMSAD
jgi:hypothetical protein